MTRGLIATVERLRAAGADVLMIDLSGNGGGSEWAEAAARIVSPVSLRSAPVAVLRSPAQHAKWQALAKTLRHAAGAANRADGPLLRDLAARAGVIARSLEACGQPICPSVVPAGYASGLLPTLPAGRFDGRSWGPLVFSAAQFPYVDGAWKGPVIVLVDDETWSAAEEFAALLRDNGAAIVMGTRSGGAGCGHMDGYEPITLAHSKAVLGLPNCVRYRKDGSNEVSGIVPDVPTGMRWNDGPSHAGRLTAARMPEAIAQARAMASLNPPRTSAPSPAARAR
jgi:hypothetical protein